MSQTESPTAIRDLDPDALRAKYRAERDKRLRETGVDDIRGSVVRIALR